MSLGPSERNKLPNFNTLDEWQVFISEHPTTKIDNSHLRHIGELLLNQGKAESNDPLTAGRQWRERQIESETSKKISQLNKDVSGANSSAAASSSLNSEVSSTENEKQTTPYREEFSSLSVNLAKYIEGNHLSSQALQDKEPQIILTGINTFFSKQSLYKPQELLDVIFDPNSHLLPSNLLNEAKDGLSKEFLGVLRLLTSSRMENIQRLLVSSDHCSKHEYYGYIQELLKPPSSFKKETVGEYGQLTTFAEKLVFLHIKKKYGEIFERAMMDWYDQLSPFSKSKLVQRGQNPFLNEFFLKAHSLAEAGLCDMNVLLKGLEGQFEQLREGSAENTPTLGTAENIELILSKAADTLKILSNYYEPFREIFVPSEALRQDLDEDGISEALKKFGAFLNSTPLNDLQESFLKDGQCNQEEFNSLVIDILKPPSNFQVDDLDAILYEIVFRHVQKKYGPATEVAMRRWFETLNQDEKYKLLQIEHNPFLWINFPEDNLSRRRSWNAHQVRENIEQQFLAHKESSQDSTLDHINREEIERILRLERLKDIFGENNINLLTENFQTNEALIGVLKLFESVPFQNLETSLVRNNHCTQEELTAHILELLTASDNIEKEGLIDLNQQRSFANELIFLLLKRTYGNATEAVARRWHDVVKPKNRAAEDKNYLTPFLDLHIIAGRLEKNISLDLESFRRSVEDKFILLCESSPDGTLDHLDFNTIKEELLVPIDEYPEFKTLLQTYNRTLEYQFFELEQTVTDEKRILRIATYYLYQFSRDWKEGVTFQYKSTYYYARLSPSEKPHYQDRKISILTLNSQGMSEGSYKKVYFFRKLTNPKKVIAMSTPQQNYMAYANNDMMKEFENSHKIRTLAKNESTPLQALPIKCHLITFNNQLALLGQKCDGDGIGLVQGKLGNFSDIDRVKCSTQIITIQIFMHKIGFIDLDRKPDNCLVTFDSKSNNWNLHTSDVSGGYFYDEDSFKPRDFLLTFVSSRQYTLEKDIIATEDFDHEFDRHFSIASEISNVKHPQKIPELEEQFVQQLESDPELKERYEKFRDQWVEMLYKRMVYAQATTIAVFLTGRFPFVEDPTSSSTTQPGAKSIPLQVNGDEVAIKTRLQKKFIDACVKKYGTENALKLIEFFNQSLHPNINQRLNPTQMASAFKEIEFGLIDYLEKNSNQGPQAASSSS